MSDRTWNPIDSRLYEEDWSEEAIIIAACIIARCPNQYGIFDTPMGFLTKFFKAIFSRQQIELVLTELEAAGFLKLYRDRRVVWIVNKWKRVGMPTGNHKKGLFNILQVYPEVKEDIISLYDPLYNLIPCPSNAHAMPMESASNDHRIPDTDTESDTEKKKIKDLASKSDADNISTVADKTSTPSKPKRKGVSIEDQNPKTPGGRLIKYWHVLYRSVHGTGYSGNLMKMKGQITTLLKKITFEEIGAAMTYLLDQDTSQYLYHDFDHFVVKVNKYVLAAKGGGYEATLKDG